ncbi:hypothetical protein MVEN_01228300 [Mycena venus]|uniref:Uncharacterized protein n=1 Tax=Mycena venus TaxID=2733690 RepID=A0A8H6Y659_9AGAR|nr:hypothetical protein MVEN_01228300 [Mycena venus]
MTTRTQTSSSPFSKLSLVAKGAQSPPPNARNSTRRPTGDDDYIPYNGPYEQPPRVPKLRNRDSWGDPLYDEDGNNMIQELHQRYASPHNDQYPWHDEDEERKGRPRARTHSGVSGHTGSSGAVDPHRSSVGVSGVSRKASHHANVARPPVPSYINLDAAGGVGESPAPPSRLSREVAPPKRSSLASIFTFGQRKLPLSPAKVPLPTSPPATSPPAAKYARAFTTQPQRPASGPPSIYSVSSDRHQTDTYTSQEGDAYHSWPAPTTRHPPQMHPYAYNQPQRDIPEPPQTAPITSPKLKFTTAQPPHRHAIPPPQQQLQQYQEAPVSAAPGILRTLKNYASTPNLRDSSRSPNRLKKPPLSALKGKDRWLSAETWCDAVMLPRPRLKIEDAQQILRGASGRIVSPPGSPVFGGFNAPQISDRPEGVASRVLAHSRSMASLRSNAEAGPSKPRNDNPVVRATTMREAPTPAPPPPQLVLPTQTERPPRPKSFAWDDLALPSPVPSLARVLEEGQILEHQRKKWQMQATGSFQNTRTRSLSRSRTKSLTQRQGKAGRSNVEYLAARSIVGNQDVVPVLPRRLHARSASQSGTNTNGTTTFNTRTSHSHSNSLVKTVSKSSLSQSQGHSRNDSWTRTAIKKAAALCYDDNVSPADEKAGGLETAIRGGGTKIIRLADPAQLPRRYERPAHDAHMGIAISTPPPNDNGSERDSIHLPSHPYAQGGVSYTYRETAPVSKGADYAGPHPAAPVAKSDPNDFSARHRLPPQASLTYHPYASPSSRRDSYQIVPRADSDVPPHSKMWAQLSPGVVREILPGELLYSPFMSERSTTPEEGTREERIEYDAYGRHRKSTATILDTVGLGETLAHAVEEEYNQRDSGLGTSEEHAHPVNELAQAEEEWADDGEAAAVEAHHPYRIHRKPVQYDISNSRPSYSTPRKTEISGASRSTKDTNHTAASSPVDPAVSHEHRLTPPTPPLPIYHPSDSSCSPVQQSEASSPPRSPPPIGSVDDLDEFRDLFYKPNLTDEVLNNLSRPVSGRQNSITWDIASTTRTQRTRTGSGLTSLARQLSQEFEELRAIRHQEHAGSVDSESSISRFSRFPTEADLQFVFADSRSELLRAIEPVRPQLPPEAMSAFHPSSHLPEDVVSSRASSPGIEGSLHDEDEQEPFRVGSVEAVSTPPAISGAHRSSFTGQLSFVGDHEREPPIPKPIPRAVSSLQPPPSADPTRSSYMTESTVSRMSNLSDFPVPPPQPAHMSVLSSYFHGVADHTVPEESQSVSTFKPRIGERF